MAAEGATDVVALARALIRCRSVTPADDGALEVCAAALASAGFKIERPVFSEPGYPDIPNLYARLGTAGPCLVFAGHTDVVPPGDEAAWRHDPFGAVIDEGWLYGRGAVDMKGGVAAALAASLAFVAERGAGFGGSIAFLLTGDEEGPAVNGTVKLLDWAASRGERFDACVLGEPTNPAVLGEMAKIGRRGSLTGRITVRGRQGHVAYPHLAANPIPILARIIEALSDTPLDEGTAHFDRSNLEWTTVDTGNGATNVVPGEVRAVFNIRFNDLWTPDSLAAAIRSRVATAAGRAEVDLRFDPTNSVAFLTEPSPFVELVAEAVEEVCGQRPALSTTGGTSDARFIKNHCPVVEFGLVGQTMHAVDERVSLDDLTTLAAVYRAILGRMFPPR
ncbi:succinyl-diaminopimelate desuccinylase [Enterovirga rhinocerotis]|uniref:Succinyl-diaminopimelate desuccinylase n=1 Tax=Enterovirga rhinocerotis TaxID=1339210 RepID=A0A4R7BVK6_9HYPH|nr:succinyl-diaminopimelate desuccinylase [Enterovirga rhinocerotis]TDR89870.1 succinyldiaminopimelate desuccinylase [Enterovirga rhinocerotis]